MHALIVQDSYILAVPLEDMLYSLGYATVDIAADVPEAIAAAQARCPA